MSSAKMAIFGRIARYERLKPNDIITMSSQRYAEVMPRISSQDPMVLELILLESRVTSDAHWLSQRFPRQMAGSG